MRGTDGRLCPRTRVEIQIQASTCTSPEVNVAIAHVLMLFYCIEECQNVSKKDANSGRQYDAPLSDTIKWQTHFRFLCLSLLKC